MELESFNDGVLLHIGVPEGPVAVEGVIAIIGEAGEDISSILEDIKKEGTSAPAASSNGQSQTQESKPAEPAPAVAQAASAPAPVASFDTYCATPFGWSHKSIATRKEDGSR